MPLGGNRAHRRHCPTKQKRVIFHATIFLLIAKSANLTTYNHLSEKRNVKTASIKQQSIKENLIHTKI